MINQPIGDVCMLCLFILLFIFNAYNLMLQLSFCI